MVLAALWWWLAWLWWRAAWWWWLAGPVVVAGQVVAGGLVSAGPVLAAVHPLGAGCPGVADWVGTGAGWPGNVPAGKRQTIALNSSALYSVHTYITNSVDSTVNRRF